MRHTFTFIFAILLFFVVTPSYSAVSGPSLDHGVTNGKHEGRMAKKAWKSKTRAERKAAKVKLKAMIKDKEGVSDRKLLLTILGILIPPLAMALYEDGITDRFWISLLLTLLFLLPGIIYTLIIILGDH